eukprot:scaffold747_cov120-Cylindrotheca_fusiformis.AAC.13
MKRRFGSNLLCLFMWINSSNSFVAPSFREIRRAGLLPVSSQFSSTIKSVGEELSSGTDRVHIPKVTLKRNRQSKSFRDGGQLVFSGSIQDASKTLNLADLVVVDVPVSSDKRNENYQPIGVGVYNPNSMYRIRILYHSLLNPQLRFDKMEPKQALVMVLNMQLKKAVEARKAMGFPSSETDTYRIVNGEGDGISGLAIDIVGGNIAVIMSSAAWCEIHKQTILGCLAAVLPEHEFIWKTTPSRLRQDGFTPRENENEIEELEDVAPVIATENGIKYQTFPHQKGQKTSVYCDQRENRLNVAKMCKGKRVLDLCCYHGGFSLNAANQHAELVVGVDSSQDAIDTCMENSKLNNFEDSISFVKSDISAYMKSCSSKFDVIILDPPKLAPTLATLNKASKKYHSLNRDALKLMSDGGGIFMTCTCSSAMTQKDGGNFFLQTVQQASLAAKRQVTLLQVNGAASCHTRSPASFPAGNYLTAAIFFSSKEQKQSSLQSTKLRVQIRAGVRVTLL